jgi:hypothetical protein
MECSSSCGSGASSQAIARRLASIRQPPQFGNRFSATKMVRCNVRLFLFYDIIPLPRLQLLVLVDQRLELLFERRQLLVHLILNAAPSAG